MSSSFNQDLLAFLEKSNYLRSLGCSVIVWLISKLTPENFESFQPLPRLRSGMVGAEVIVWNGVKIAAITALKHTSKPNLKKILPHLQFD